VISVALVGVAWQWREKLRKTLEAENARLEGSAQLAQRHWIAAYQAMSQARDTRSVLDYQQVWLHALQAQRTPLRGRSPIDLDTRDILANANLERAFSERGSTSRAEFRDNVEGIAFSADGTLLAASSEAGTIRVWQAETGRPVNTFFSNAGAVRSVAFSHDHRLLALATADGMVQVWNLETGDLAHVLRDGHNRYVSKVAFDPKGRFLVSGNDQGTIRLWDAKTWQCLGRRSIDGGYITGLVFDPDGTAILTSTEFGTVALYGANKDLPDLALKTTLSGVAILSVSLDGTRVAAVDQVGAFSVWSFANEKDSLQPLVEETPVDAEISSIAFTADGGSIVIASDKGLQVFDAQSGKMSGTLRWTDGDASAIAFSSDGNAFAVSSGSGRVALRNWEGAFIPLDRQDSIGEASQVANGTAVSRDPSAADNSQCKKSDDGSWEACIEMGDVVLSDPATGRRIATLDSNDDTEIFAFAFDGESQMIATGSNGGRVQLRDLATRKPIASISIKEPVHSVALTTSGGDKRRLVAAGLCHGEIILWDPNSSDGPVQLKGHQLPVEQFAFSPDAWTLASASADQTIRLWDVRGARQIGLLNVATDYLTQLAFDGNHRLVVAQGDEARRWDLQTLQRLDNPVTDGGTIESLTLSSDGRLFALGPEKGGPRLRSTVTTEPTSRLESSITETGSVAFSPGGELFAASGKSGLVEVWNLGNGDPSPPCTDFLAGIKQLEFGHGNRLAIAKPDGVFDVPSVSSPCKSGLDLEGYIPDEGSGEIAYSPDGATLAIRAHDGSIRLWDTDHPSDTPRFVIPAQNESYALPSRLAFDPSGKLLASAGGDDGTVALFDLRTHTMLAPLVPGPMRLTPSQRLVRRNSDMDPYEIRAIDFSKDGQVLATGSADDFVRLWSTQTRTEIARLPAAGTEVWSVAYSPKGDLLLAGNQQGLRWWDPRVALLLDNGKAPSPRASLISEVLQRLWGWRFDGAKLRRASWTWLKPRKGRHEDQIVTIDIRPAEATADPDGKEILRSFDMGSLYHEPLPGEDKLQQLIRWIDEQDMSPPASAR